MPQTRRRISAFTAFLGMVGFSALAGLLVAVMVAPAVAVTAVAASSTIGVFESLPEFVRIDPQPQRNEIYALAGKKGGKSRYQLIASIYHQDREEVQWDQVSDNLKWAAVAGEDRRFYEHGGVDVAGVIRVAIKNAASGGVSGGASTLSMQLVKNIFIQKALQAETDEERKAGVERAQQVTFDRKLKEMKLAIGLEKKYSKDEILLKYLNIAGFGGTTYGVEAAAQRYYGVSASDVSIAQAASIIAIVQKPSSRSLESPENYEANKTRRDKIIRDMWEIGKISGAERDEALATPVDKTTVALQAPKQGCIAAHKYAKHFCDYVLRSIKDLPSLGATVEERRENWALGGYRLYTTLDLRLQKVSHSTIRQYADPKERAFQLGGASTTVQVGTGRILAMAQNKAFNDTPKGAKKLGNSAINFNADYAYGGSSGFQVGSTYKVFTLINWLQQGFGLGEVLNVNPRTVAQSSFTDSCGGPHGGTWPFRNDSNETGTRTVEAATAGSVNGGFVTMAQALDQCDTKKAAIAMGVHAASKTFADLPDESGLDSNPAAILGTNNIAPLTMAAAYAGIANNGLYCAPIAIDRIVTVAGDELPGQERKCKQALDPEVMAATQRALMRAMDGYIAKPHDGIPIIGKTGTTNDSVQTYVIGATTKVSTIVWIGNIKGAFPIRSYRPGGIYGGDLRHLAGDIILRQANRLYPGGAFAQPPSRLITGKPVVVPDLEGQSVDTVKGILRELGLSYAEGKPVNSDYPEGTVARTMPAAGSTISRGGTVTVRLSTGVPRQDEEDEEDDDEPRPHDPGPEAD